MKLKKALALILILSMTLPFLPVFEFTVSALTGSELLMSEWEDYAKEDGALVFDYSVFEPTQSATEATEVGTEVATEPSLEEATEIPTDVESAYGKGWYSAWSGTDNDGSDDTNTYANINVLNNYLQIYGPAGRNDVLKTPGYGEESNFVILEYWLTRPVGAVNDNFIHDFKFMDLDGDTIEIGSIGRTDGLQSGAYGNESHSYYAVAPQEVLSITEVEPTEPTEATAPSDYMGDIEDSIEALSDTGVSAASLEYETVVPEAYKVHTGYNAGVRVVFANNSNGTYSVTYFTAGSNANEEFAENEYLNNYQSSWEDNRWYKAYSITYKGQFDGFGSISYSIRGCGELWQNSHDMKFLKIYAGRLPGVDVNVTYTLNGEAVKTIKKSYDKDGGEEEVVFEEFYYSPNGTNTLYYAPAAAYSESGEVELTALPNSEGLAIGTYFKKNGQGYKVIGTNELPNGDFAYGLNGWYNGAAINAAADAFKLNGDGTVDALLHHPHNAEGSLFRVWETRKDVLYSLSYTSNVNNPYEITSMIDHVQQILPPRFAESPDGTVIAGLYTTEPYFYQQTYTGDNHMVFTAEEDYVQVSFRWLGKHDDKTWATNTFGNFSLQEIEPVPEIASVDEFPAIEVVSGNEPVLPLWANVTYTDGTTDTLRVSTWNTESISFTAETDAAHYTVSGYVGDIEVSVNVTVYPQLFALRDLSSNKVRSEGDLNKVSHMRFTNQGNATEGTAQPVSGIVKFEFDLDWRLFEGGHIIGFSNADVIYSSQLYGGNQQIQFGTEKAIGATDYNNADFMGKTYDNSTYTPITTGKYRVFVKTNTLKHTYNIRLTDEDGNFVADFNNLTYRKNADILDTFILTENYKADQSALTYSDMASSNLRISASNEITINYVDNADKTTVIYTEVIDVPFGASAISTTEGERFYLAASESKAYILSAAETMSADAIKCDGTDTLEYNVLVDIISDNAVLQDTYANNTAAPSDNSSNLIFVAGTKDEKAPTVDMDGNSTTSFTTQLGSTRIGLLEFAVPEVGENEAVILTVYIADANENINKDATFSLAAIPAVIESFNEEEGYLHETFLPFDEEKAIWSDNAALVVGDVAGGRSAVDEYMTFDVTEAVKAAEGDTIIFALHTPTGGCYIVDREKAVLDAGEYQGLAAYLSKTAGYSITVTGADKVTKNGSLVANPENGFIVPTEGSGFIPYAADTRLVAFTNNKTKVYKLEGGKTDCITPTEDGEYSPVTFGIDTINGAQVRFGDGVDENGKVLSGNGLRFIAQASFTDTLVNIANSEEAKAEGAEFGLMITAEGSQTPVYIATEKWQDEADGIFTAALTDLAVSNYNRNFTAVPYIKIDGQEFIGTDYSETNSVTRSIYQVSVGLLKSGAVKDIIYQENPEDYQMFTSLKNVLQAYVNQVGIRLTYTADGTITAREADKSGAYTSDEIFFSVESVDNGDGSYTITITPDQTYNTPVEIKTWWTDYVRINNNNTQVKNMISENWSVDEESGALTFTFTPVKSSN